MTTATLQLLQHKHGKLTETIERLQKICSPSNRIIKGGLSFSVQINKADNPPRHTDVFLTYYTADQLPQEILQGITAYYERLVGERLQVWADLNAEMVK